MKQDLFSFTYLIATILFVFGLKGLSSPKTAMRGNLFAMIGMAIAIFATVLHPEVKNYTWIIAGFVIGGGIGTTLALRVQMTSMPELVAVLHQKLRLHPFVEIGITAR